MPRKTDALKKTVRILLREQQGMMLMGNTLFLMTPETMIGRLLDWNGKNKHTYAYGVRAIGRRRLAQEAGRDVPMLSVLGEHRHGFFCYSELAFQPKADGLPVEK